MTAKELAKELASAVLDLRENTDATYHFVLDGEFMVHVGYSDGYDPDSTDDGLIHDPEEPSWCINAKVGENSWDEYSFCYMPWNVTNGEVWDNEVGISENEDYYSTAKWLLKEYRAMRKELRNGTITF